MKGVRSQIRDFFLAVTVFGVGMLLAPSVMADPNCTAGLGIAGNACQNNDNSVTNQGGAGGQGGQGGTGIGVGIGKGGDANAAAAAAAAAQAAAFASQKQGQEQAQGQLQGQAQGQIGINKQGQVGINANKQTNKQTMVYKEAEIPANTTQEIKYSGEYTLKNVPAVVAPNIYPSSPCMGSSSVGGSGVGFGLSFGTSWVDEECQKMEAARNAPTAADKVYVWCQGKFNAGSPSCKGATKVSSRDDAARDGDDRRRSTPAALGSVNLPASSGNSGLVASPDGRLWQKKDGDWMQVSATTGTFSQ